MNSEDVSRIISEFRLALQEQRLLLVEELEQKSRELIKELKESDDEDVS